MTIVLTGGGSGGHITPILAVAAELKRLQPQAQLIYIGQRGDSLGDIPANDYHIDQAFTVAAGKFRRYHGEGIKQLLDIPTLLKNVRDVFLVLIGIWQSWRLIGRLKADVVFSRGGFVSVPVGLGAALRRVPYITHDSDAVPSLANRLIAHWASLHAVALPEDTYPYSADKTVTTGIPLQADFVPVTQSLKHSYRQEIDVPESAKLLFIIGGGLGSQAINRSVSEVLPLLLQEYHDLYIRHIVGRANETAMLQLYKDRLSPAEQGRVKVYGYLKDVYRYSGAADLIVTRAGATNLAEFAAQAKACIVIPSSFLAGGHQLENARYLEERQAAVVISEADVETDPHCLAKQVSQLLKKPEYLQQLGRRLGELAKPQAAHMIAELVIKQGDKAIKHRKP